VGSDADHDHRPPQPSQTSTTKPPADTGAIKEREMETLAPEALDAIAEAAFQSMVAAYKHALEQSEDHADALIKRYRTLEESGEGSILARKMLRSEIEHWNEVAHSQRRALRSFVNEFRNGPSFEEEAGHGTADHTALWVHAVVQAPLLDRIAELEAERDDLLEELDSVRSALRDRWSSVLPKGSQ